MSECKSLVIKDLMIYKKFLLFVFIPYSFFEIIFFAKKSDLENCFCLIQPVITGFFLFFIFYIFEEEKNHGTELLTITPYSRKSIVISRYYLGAIIFDLEIFMLLVYNVAIFSVIPILNLSVLIFTVSLFLSIMIPLSFNFSCKVFALICGLILICFVSLFSNFSLKNINNMVEIFLAKNSANIYIFNALMLIASTVFIIISINVSKRIYCKKDL